MNKDINEWTKKEFEALPRRQFGEDIGEFDNMIILPMKTIHDSGYRNMDFVAVRGNEPICRLSGCSDVLHINGIGGYGYWDVDKGVPTTIDPQSWNVDCLRKSKLLRLFLIRPKRMAAGQALSSFEVFAVKNK